MDSRKKLLKDQRILLVFVIVAIIAVVSMISSKFTTVENLITIFQQVSAIGILTMAMSMLLISGDIDLPVENIVVLSGVVVIQVINTSRNAPLAVVAGIGTAVVCGVLNGFVTAKSKCIPLIITLGTSQVFYGLALIVSGGKIMSFGSAFNAIGKTKLFDVFPVMLSMLTAMVMLSYFLMNKTKFGRRIVAIGGNRKNAFLSDINVTRYKIITYAITGSLCAVAAVVSSARTDSIIANAGTGYETSALTAAIIGGATFDGDRGTVSGALLGCVFMGVINNATNIFQVETYIQTTVTGAIIVCAVVSSNIDNIRKKQEVGQW